MEPRLLLPQRIHQLLPKVSGNRDGSVGNSRDRNRLCGLGGRGHCGMYVLLPFGFPLDVRILSPE